MGPLAPVSPGCRVCGVRVVGGHRWSSIHLFFRLPECCRSGGSWGGDALSGKRQYAGLVIQGKHNYDRNLFALHKVAAHKNPHEDGITASERFRRLGNFHADIAAKEGASVHPSLDPDDRAALDRRIKIAQHILRAGAVLLPRWPRLEFRGTARSKPTPIDRTPLLTVGHSWSKVGTFWQCRVCLLGSRAKCPPSGDCPGQSRLDQGVLLELGHKVLAFPCSNGSHLFVCLHCKFYSSGAQVKKLGQPCGKPTVTSIRNMRRLKQGRHPDNDQVNVDIDDFYSLL